MKEVQNEPSKYRLPSLSKYLTRFLEEFLNPHLGRPRSERVKSLPALSIRRLRRVAVEVGCGAGGEVGYRSLGAHTSTRHTHV